MKQGLFSLNTSAVKFFFVAVGMCLSCVAQAQDSLWDLLSLSHEQARSLSYSGLLMTQSEGVTRSSKLLHQKGPAGEFEVLERLDGQSARWVRLNEEIQCVLPEKKLILSEKSSSSLWAFSHLFSEEKNVRLLEANYNIKELPVKRVAGREARLIQLSPKDDYRYVHSFYLDKQKNLLLRSNVLSLKGHVLEQVGFTEISFGLQPLPKAELLQVAPGWKMDSTEIKPLMELDLPYSMPDSLAGFKRTHSLCRIKVKEKQVHQIIYSDGLSTLSVFVQKMLEGQSSMPQVPMSYGAVMSKSEKQGQYLVTALGEVPEKTLNLFLKSVKWKSQ